MNDNKDINVRFGSASQRRHHRLTAPLAVYIGSQQYTALDWSTAGIRLRSHTDECDQFSLDDTVVLVLAVPFHDFNVSIELVARAVRIDADTGDVAFMFVDPPERATELLHYFADHLIRGEMAPIDGTIKRLDLPVTPPAPTPPPKSTDAKQHKRQALRSVLIGSTYLLVGVFVAVALFYTGYSNFFLVTSDQALVYTPSVDMIAQENGIVEKVFVAEGEHVMEGNPLLQLQSPRLEQRLSEAKLEVRAAENQRSSLEASIKSEQKTLGTYRQIATDQVAAARARLSSARTQQTLSQRQFERASKLAKQHLISSQDFDRVASERKRTLETVSEARADLRIAQSALKAAKMGEYYSSNRLESRLPTLRNDLASAVNRVELANSRLQEIQKQVDRLLLRAPVDGQVRQITVPAGGAVTAGSQVLNLLTDQDIQVYARISSDQLGRISVGDAANVYVPALSRNLQARVVSVEPRLWSLPHNVRRLLGDPTDGGLVVLGFDYTPEVGIARLNPGLPVTVQLKNNMARDAIRRIASVFRSNVSNAAASQPVHETIGMTK